MTIDEIVALAGGVMKLAEITGADHSTVCHWKRVERIPVERALIISGRLDIPLHEIRPDIWRAPETEAAA